MNWETGARRGIRLAASAAIAAAILALYYLWLPVNHTTVALSLLLAILGLATRWGLPEAILASFVAVAGFNFFFLPPVGTFTIADPQNWVALVAFLVTAITASQLSVRARRQAAEAIGRRRELERLYALGQAMLMTGGLRPTPRDFLNLVMRTFEAPAIAFFNKADGEFHRSGPAAFGEEELRAAAERDEPLVDEQRCTALVAVRLGGTVFGSLGLAGVRLSKTVLKALANLVAIGLERARVLEEASRAELAHRSEAFKSALAHDLKTPLTSIKGSVTHLLARGPGPEERELLSIANEETDRLNRLVVEVLEMARIEASKLHPDRQPHRVSSLVAGALRELEGTLQGHPVSLDLPEGLPPA